VPTLFTFPHFSDINSFRTIQNVDDGRFRGPAATFSGYPPRQTKSPPLWSGWLSFCSSDCALFALFYFTIIVIVCIPPALTNLVFFLSFFHPISLVVGCRLFFPPYSYSSLVPTPIPRRHRPRGCSHCSSAASASHSSAVLLLGSSTSVLLLGANPRPFCGGIGGVPARFLGGALGAPHWSFLGGSPHRPRLGDPRLGGAPHKTSVVSAGAPPWFLVLRCCSA
jgi:hypothetical protein